MSDAKLPKLFRDALEAQEAGDAIDPREHPRIYRRRWQSWQSARIALRQEYPRLESWLFPYTGFEQAKVDELLRLIAEAQVDKVLRDELLRLRAEAQKEASDVHS